MLARLSSFFRPATVATAVLLAGWGANSAARAQVGPQLIDDPGASGPMGPSLRGPTAPGAGQTGASQSTTPNLGLSSAPGGQWLGIDETVCPGGLYGGAFHTFGCRKYGGPGYYGFFRRYYGYAYYGPNYCLGPGGPQYGLGVGSLYQPRRACLGRTHQGVVKSGEAPPTGPIARAPARETTYSPTGAATTTAPPAEAPPQAEQLPPPTPDTAHLQLLVPAQAEVLVDGHKTRKTGTVREFVSPPLTPGKNLVYTITVRVTDADGKITDDIHTVHVQPNDRLRIDCTHPAAPEQPRTALLRP